MASPKTEVNPFVRRTMGRRIADALLSVRLWPSYVWQTFKSWPKALRLLVAGLGALSLAFGLFSVSKWYLKREENIKVISEWRTIDNEFRTTNDVEKVKESLDRILAIRPGEPLAVKYKEALTKGQCDPNEIQLWMLVVREHQKNDRTAEVVREAERRIAVEPKDYYAHFLLAKSKLEKNDLSGAQPHLAVLEAPDANPVNLNFVALAMAMNYLRGTGKDSTRVRTFVSERVIPMLKADWIANADPETQIMFVHMYSEIFELPKLPVDAYSTWPAASELMRRAYEKASEKNDVPLMGRVAMLGGRLAAGLNLLRTNNQITEPERVEYSRELEGRTQTAWSRVLQKESKTPEAYVGLVESFARSGNINTAIETLTKGLDACGDNPQLLEIFWKLTMQSNPMLGYLRLKEAAERNPKYPKYWMMAAQCAAAADRRDFAFAALEKARQELPGDVDVAILQAAMYNGTDHPEKVLEALSILPDTRIPNYPRVCQLFSQALTEIGDTERLDGFLESALEFSKKENNPQPAYFSALGMHEAARPTPDRAQKTADYLTTVVERWRIEFPPGMQLHAAALFRVCDLSPGDIDPVKSRAALLALERARQVEPNHVPTSTNILLLRLRGDQDPIKALGEIDPLVARIDQLLPEQAAALGMVYVQNKRYDDAIRVLEPYTKGRVTPECWIQLALAYNGQGRLDEAQAALRRASDLSMSDRDRADYISARDLIHRVKS